MTPQQLLETPDLISVGVAGDEVRKRLHGSRTTFVRVFEVHVDAPIQTLPPRVSAGEFRVVGAPASLDAAVAAVGATAALAGAVPVTGFSLIDLQRLPQPLAEVCRALRGAGLAAVAFLPVDTDTHLAEAVRTAREGGLHVLTLTVEAVARSGALEVCERAAALQERIGGFRAFAPLNRTVPADQPTTGYDDVKTIALARTVVRNVPSIQVDWALYGPKLAQVALTAGADDVDSVAAQDPGILGTRRSPLEEIKGNITAAALEPVERDALFRAQAAGGP